MLQTRHFRDLTACTLAIVLTGATSMTLAAESETETQARSAPGMMQNAGPGYGPGMMQGWPRGSCGPGMMRGYGPGMMQGYGPGMMQGYGPGMMQGYGPGMMQGYGPGMMQGYGPGMMQGYGPGMMRGYGPGMMQGYGPGMMQGYGPGPNYGPDGNNLTDQQRQRLQEIRQEHRQKHWQLMEKAWEEQQRLYRLNQAPEPDYEAIEKSIKALGELRQQMAEEWIQTRRRIQEALDEAE
jgi:Spy/CpxP family protein refolding chaperone